jgi:uncharacterized membrane protein
VTKNRSDAGPAPAATTGSAGPVKPRLDSVDFLRGLAMVLMGLDHVRIFFSNAPFGPTDLAQTTPAHFLTKWVSQLAAPAFFFLAGTAVFLSMTRGRTKRQLSWLLLTRGLWLVFLELTVMRVAWTLSLDYHTPIGQVLWAMGWCMVLMAPLVHLPTWAVAAVGIVVVAGHNAFDAVRPETFGAFGWLWSVLHKRAWLEPFAGVRFRIMYPLLPWLGIMASGYGFGRILLFERERRRRWLFRLGVGILLGFVALRATNLYGDMLKWSTEKNTLFTIFSFVNCKKYPPSLLYAMMKLGIDIIILALFDRKLGPLARRIVVFGRVPMFFYLIHVYVIHGLEVGLAFVRYGPKAHEYLSAGMPRLYSLPDEYRWDLWVVYAVWIAVMVGLYFVCHWYAGVKRRSRSKWLSYL